MTAETVSRWARRYVLTSVLFLVVWQAGVLVEIPRRTEVVLGLFGFVLTMLFGKAYSLVPTYFNRDLAFASAPAVQFPLVVAGTATLAVASLQIGPAFLGVVGAALWTFGVGVFLGTHLWTIRGNLSGRETATGEVDAQRRPVDRTANAFVPVALLYLFAGAYETLALSTPLPEVLAGYAPQVTHLLAAGTASLFVFAIGFRLLPRFMVASPPRSLVAVTLAAGAVGPVLLSVHLGTGLWFRVGAVLEAFAVVGYALGCTLLYVRSDRRRVGFYGVLAGAASGVIAVGLGLSFAFGQYSPSLVVTHLRLNLLGFLGLTIVGVAYQFYPPAVGALPGTSDRTALLSIGLLFGGLLVQLGGTVGTLSSVQTLGHVMTFTGATLYAFVLVAVFRER